MCDNTKLKCEECDIQGYSPQLCQLHQKRHSSTNGTEVTPPKWMAFAKPALIGAGLGATGTLAGLAVLPALGMKALLGHALGLKIAGAGGACGAGTNTVIANRKKKNNHKSTTAKKHMAILPNKFRGVSHV